MSFLQDIAMVALAMCGVAAFIAAFALACMALYTVIVLMGGCREWLEDKHQWLPATVLTVSILPIGALVARELRAASDFGGDFGFYVVGAIAAAIGLFAFSWFWAEFQDVYAESFLCRYLDKRASSKLKAELATYLT